MKEGPRGIQIENFNDFEETIDKSNDFEETIDNVNGFEETIENLQWFWRTISPLNVFWYSDHCQRWFFNGFGQCWKFCFFGSEPKIHSFFGSQSA